MCRQLPADAGQARHRAGVQLFQPARDPAMPEPAPHRAQLAIRHFPNAVVREIVLRARFVDQAALPQFIQSARKAVFVPIGGLRQQVQRERPTHGRGETGQFVGLRRQLSQTCANHRVDTRALQAGAHALHHEQWITFGGAIYARQFGGIERAFGHLPRKRISLLPAERRQRKLHQAPQPPQLARQARERMVAAGFLGPQRSHHQDAPGSLHVKQGGHPFQRIRIAPLQIVDDQQQRLAHSRKHGAQRFVKVMPLPALGKGSWSRDGGIFRQNLRQHPRQFRQLRLRQLGPRRPQRFGPQPFGHGREGKLPLRRVAARPRHRLDRTSRSSLAARTPCEQLFGEARFSYPGLARNQRQTHRSLGSRSLGCRSAGCRPRALLPAFQQTRPLRLSAHQR